MSCMSVTLRLFFPTHAEQRSDRSHSFPSLRSRILYSGDCSRRCYYVVFTSSVLLYLSLLLRLSLLPNDHGSIGVAGRTISSPPVTARYMNIC